MSESVIVLGTHHELQGSKRRPGNIDDPLYEELIVHLIANQTIDFVFEEATGLGPTTAERLSVKQASVVRAKPAMRGHFKTGHMGWPRTWSLFIPLSLDQASPFWFSSSADRISGCARDGVDDRAWR
jgi:hypothetical protein